ncbi:MAG: beta strand repeat-containing protein, partial [Bacteroidota bacterium]
GATGIGTATGLPAGVTAAWASNTITVSGTPTVAGTYDYSIPLTGGVCGGSTATGRIVVTAAPIVTAAANTTTFCGSGTVNFTGSTNITGTSVVGNQDFENTATYTATGGSTKTGTSGSGDRPASASFVSSPTTSYWVNNGTATITTQNFTGLQNGATKTVSMRLASFSIGSTTNGAESTDNVWVDISLDGGTTYSREIEVNGGAGGSTHWGFSTGTGVASVTYDGNNTATIFAPTTSGAQTTNGFSLLQITLPTSATQVRVRVRLFNNSGSEAWVIDDIVVSQTIVPTYSWTSNPSGFTSALQDPSGVSVSASTTYTLTATNIATGCSGSDDVAITVTPNNTASLGSSTPTLCVNTALTAITHATTGATGIGTPTNLPAGVTASFAGNTITISGTPSASGTFNYTIPLTGGCGSVNATGTIQVTPSVSINPFSAATVARCQGAETVSYTTTATNSTSITYTIDANSLAAGNSINSATGLVTYVATWSGNTIVTATAFGCGGPVSTVCTVTSSPLSVGGQLAGGDVRVCHGTVPPDLTLSGHTGTILRWEISADSSFTNSTAIANGGEVLPGSVVGAITDMIYIRAVVRSGSCAFAYSNVVTFTLGSTSWNGSVWSEGEPDQYTTAYITANYTPTSDLSACRLFVSNNAVVSIPENVNVILSGALTVANGSTFILEHNSNLTQTASASNAVNSGSIIVKEATPRLRRQDYALFSSPVIGQQLQSFSPNTLA